ncbi:MAG TPA: hypothetical protein VIU14_02755 [Mesorhizobium sp.]|jgi:hypothetical protein
MKTVLPMTLLLALAGSQAHAIERYQTMRMTCGEVQSVLQNEGAAILRWQSRNGSNLPRYDRYVVDSRFCNFDEFTRYEGVPTRDNPACGVYKCEQAEPFDGRIFIPY